MEASASVYKGINLLMILIHTLSSEIFPRLVVQIFNVVITLFKSDEDQQEEDQAEKEGRKEDIESVKREKSKEEKIAELQVSCERYKKTILNYQKLLEFRGLKKALKKDGEARKFVAEKGLNNLKVE